MAETLTSRGHLKCIAEQPSLVVGDLRVRTTMVVIICEKRQTWILSRWLNGSNGGTLAVDKRLNNGSVSSQQAKAANNEHWWMHKSRLFV